VGSSTFGISFEFVKTVFIFDFFETGDLTLIVYVFISNGVVNYLLEVGLLSFYLNKPLFHRLITPYDVTLDDALSSLLFNSSKVASCLTDDTGVA
jgi:hypothetical protein